MLKDSRYLSQVSACLSLYKSGGFTAEPDYVSLTAHLMKRIEAYQVARLPPFTTATNYSLWPLLPLLTIIIPFYVNTDFTDFHKTCGLLLFFKNFAAEFLPSESPPH